ncbi:hypothetical protein GCM10027575_73220 [Phytohabitans suffuscus]
MTEQPAAAAPAGNATTTAADASNATPADARPASIALDLVMNHTPNGNDGRNIREMVIQRVNTTVEMLRGPTLTVTCPPFTVVGWLAALAFCEVR